MIAVGTESGLEMVGVEGGQDTERECPILCVRGGWFTSSPRIGRGKPRLVG